MIKKYCRGLPLYFAAVAATLFFHGLAQHWGDQSEARAKQLASARHI